MNTAAYEHIQKGKCDKNSVSTCAQTHERMFMLSLRYSKLYTQDTLQWLCKKADRVIHLHCEMQCTLGK